MLITNSPDITQLSVEVTWDISGTLPVISLVNLSTGSGLANCVWAFVATSPTGTYIHNGSIDSPDITGTWSTHTLTDAWPRPFNQIEWSGAPYSFYVIVKDSSGNIYQDAPQTASICRPAGNTQASKNTFGLAKSNVSVKCSEARIYFEDTTYHSYKGSDGTQAGSVLKVIYPIDETGTIPSPFPATDYTVVLVPISYSSSNYQFWQFSVYDYDLGNNTLVRIKYQTIQTFSVWCNVDLEPLVCEFNKLIDSINDGTCTDINEAKNKLVLVSPKMFLLFMGIMQPLTGIDVPSLIEEIKTIGGFDCNCCIAATGIIPQTSAIIDGYNFIVNSVCGDITGTVSVNGTNITFNLQDKSYVFSIVNESPSELTAFSVITSINGCQKTYALAIDGNQLATDILNIISDSSSLVNLFNSIVNNGGDGSFNLLVDGKCIFQTTTSCDYTFVFLNIPASTTYAILTSIKIDSTTHVVNFAFNESNIAAFQAYLNGLGYGTFVVTDLGAGQLSVTSANNVNNFVAIAYSVASVNYVAGMTKNCTGYLPISANEAVQNIIDFLCGITDEKIETSSDYTICYIDPADKSKKTVTISGGAALSDFIEELLARGCDTINYIIGLSATTCTNIKNLFPVSAQVMQANDFVLGTKNDSCAKIYPVEFGTRQLQLGLSDPDFMIAFCAAVAACGGGLPCTPFNYFYLTGTYGSPADDTMDIIVNFNHSDAIAFTLRYARIDNTNTPIYTTIPNVLPGDNPYVISGVDDGQYFVGMTPIYSDGRLCTETSQNSSACTGITAFSAVTGGSPTDEFIVSYSAIVSLPKIRVNISYPNGGSWSQIYTNDGLDITIPIPTNVFGDFSITITPVCNENTGFFGAPTAPIILTVSDPDPDVVPLTVFLTRSGSAGSGTLFAFITGGVPPYSYIFSVNTSGPCQAYTLDTPSGTSFDGDGINTAYTVTLYAAVTYTFLCTVSDDASTVAVSNFIVNPACLIPSTMITLKDGTEKAIGDLQVGEELFGENNKVESWEELTVDKLYSLNSGLLKTSEGHINIIGKALVQSCDLLVGIHSLTGKYGNEIPITDIKIEEGEFKVINIKTTNETFIANSILTHNKIACP